MIIGARAQSSYSRSWRAFLTLLLLACCAASSARANVSILYSFTAESGDGLSELLDGRDGYYYATAQVGGANNQGTVLRFSEDGTVKVMYSFDGSKGANPVGGVILGGDGSLYGTTSSGGANGYGGVFRITRAGALTSLHDFTLADGGGSKASLLLGSDGALYGVTAGDLTTPFITWNPRSYGGVFRITPAGAFTLLHAFAGRSDGGQPLGALVQASNGTLYGTTSQIIDNGFHPISVTWGTVFSIQPSGAQFSTLHAFTGTDGANPRSRVLLASDRSIWGTTAGGTQWMGPSSSGSIFKIDASGNFTTLRNFTYNAPEGSVLNDGLARGSDGNLYATTTEGSDNGVGALLRVSPSGVVTKLYAFSASDGRAPWKLTEYGYGLLLATGGSTVFTLGLGGTARNYARVGYRNGANPIGAAVLASDGNYYGTVSAGGAYGYGGVYRATPSGVFTLLASFPKYGSGAGPLVEGRDGALYTLASYGTSGYGAIVRTTKGGVVSLLYSFPDSSTGYQLSGNGLLANADGSLVGATQAIVFQVSSSGVLTKLASAVGESDSLRTPVRGRDGKLYGSSEFGGANVYYGGIYRVDAGVLTYLYSFSGPDGSSSSALVLGPDGNFYGTTGSGGGDIGGGTVFRVTPQGALTTLHAFTFNDALDGDLPSAPVLIANNTLYGSTLDGGANGSGAAFSISASGVFKNLGALPASGVATDRWVHPSQFLRGADGSIYGAITQGGKAGVGAIIVVSP